jgi:hypothetical protein
MSGYVSVDVDIDDVLDQLSDEELMEAALSRKGSNELQKFEEGVDLQVVQLAYDALMRGDTEYCALLLERAIHPKWATPDAAAKAYVKAIGTRQ